ncbi:MAG: biotin synthase BioB [Gammaproteobacteria bacterium]|nr:biotin synthase BioB [Gammaproteobacteria bacterium]
MESQITWVENKKIAPPTVDTQRWSVEAIEALFALPFNDLIFKAQQVHREHFDANTVQLSTLLSIKTGGCPEDCGYCPQSAKYNTGVEAEKLMPIEEVLKAAQAAKDKGATRFCMGAAWRSPKDHQVDAVGEMVTAVKAMGLETCVTLGMLKEHQAKQLQEAGLDYYNHNLDTSPDFYGDIISTRTYQDRLDTLDRVRDAGIKVCCGGIVGLGETVTQRAGLIAQLANMAEPPESVPINNLVKVEGTPLADNAEIDPLDFVRTIAVARITMPTSFVRLSAGRESMNESTQALCFLAGANSILYGEKLLVTDNPELERDTKLFEKLGLKRLEN